MLLKYAIIKWLSFVKIRERIKYVKGFEIYGTEA